MRKICLMLLCLSLVACSKASKTSAEKSGESVTQLGDPAQLVWGATMKNELPLDLFKEECSYFLASRNEFVSEIPTQTEAEYNQKQSPPKNHRKDIGQLYDPKDKYCLSEYTPKTFKSDKSIYFRYSPQGEWGHNFILKRGKWVYEIVALEYKGSEYILNPDFINTSVLSDHSAFSILVYDNNYSGAYKRLYDYYFTKRADPGVMLKPLSDKYNFITTNGWDQKETLNISICGSQAVKHKDLILSAIQEWQKVLEGRLNISVSVQEKNYPAFNDINTHCISVVDSFSEDNVGSTIGIESDHMLDADIFIYRISLLHLHNYTEGEEYLNHLRKTALHEMGHLLGLHHQFDSQIKSVMSYNRNIQSLQPYDIEAIQELYPLKAH